MVGIFAAPLFSGAEGAPGVVSVPDDNMLENTKVTWSVGADGFIYKNGLKRYTWIVPQSGMASFEVRAAISGSPLVIDAGTDVWISPLTNPVWGYEGVGAAMMGDLTIEIRNKSDLAIVDTALITLETGGSLRDNGDYSDPRDFTAIP